MTDTATTESVSLERGSLVLVTVTEDYYAQTMERPSGGMTGNPHATEESRTFYATASRDMGSAWVCLVVPTDDPRALGMWGFTPEAYGLSEVLNDGKDYRGWNVERRYVSVVVDNSARPTISQIAGTIELDKDKRATLPIQEAYPVGSVWNHFESTQATVTGYVGDRYLQVTQRALPSGAPESGREWIRGALDSYGTFVGWDEDQKASQEATGSPVTADESTGGTYTQSQLDEAVREALAEERRKMEAWKEEANEIAIRYAENNDLCGEFERCMEEIGFRGRHNDYTVTFSVTVSARDDDEAREEAASILYNDSLTDLRYRIIDVDEV